MKTFALALGGGGARGLGHIAVIEALDEMGVKPAAIAGASMGALVGAAYAAGLSGKDLRHHVIALAHDRGAIFRRLVAARSGAFANMFTAGWAGATLVDAEKFVAQFLPDSVPQDFADLTIPLTVATSDLYGRREMPISSGPLKPALAASIALPGLLRPVVIGERVLIDGGATNPLPFDHLVGRADVVVAVDVSGEPAEARRDLPNPWEALIITVFVMANAIVGEKLKHSAPDLMLRPNVGIFRTLDFTQASAILRAADPVKAEVKEKLAALLTA
jgi:NTE family protein